MPGDPTFSQINQKYVIPSYKRICAEFGINADSDFRFKRGLNHGLGNVYIFISYQGQSSTDFSYPGYNKFSDEGGSAQKGNLIYFIKNDDEGTSHQFDWFMPKESEGLTKAGESRLNQSIEAFVYCILGSQVNVRSSIIGSGGSAKEVQSEFLVLMEDAIRQPDISKSVQRFQLAVDEAKVRLDLAISPGTWLMPSNLLINTQTTIGYNNKLKKATAEMKLGVNNTTNSDTKSFGIKLMDGGKLKTKRLAKLDSRDAKGKAEANARGHNMVKAKANKSSLEQESVGDNESSAETKRVDTDATSVTSDTTNHEVTKAGVFIAVAVSAFVLWKVIR